MSATPSLKEMIEANATLKIADTENDWDISFSQNIAVNYAKYGIRTLLSDKQLKHITRIYNANFEYEGAEDKAAQEREQMGRANLDDDIPF